MAEYAQSGTVTAQPVTEEVFLDDRKKFWSFFTGLVFYVSAFLVVLLILLAFFLV